jgi:aminoglycoside phosphotransferase (APT) family kinase protein
MPSSASLRVMSGLHGTDVPVPRMHVLCEDESVIGRAFYVMEFMQGRVLWDQSLPGMTPTERGAIYDEMNRVICRAAHVKFADAGLAATASPATTSSARSAAGASSTWPPSPSPSKRWTG